MHDNRFLRKFDGKYFGSRYILEGEKIHWKTLMIEEKISARDLWGYPRWGTSFSCSILPSKTKKMQIIIDFPGRNFGHLCSPVKKLAFTTCVVVLTFGTIGPIAASFFNQSPQRKGLIKRLVGLGCLQMNAAEKTFASGEGDDQGKESQKCWLDRTLACISNTPERKRWGLSPRKSLCVRRDIDVYAVANKVFCDFTKIYAKCKQNWVGIEPAIFFSRT